VRRRNLALDVHVAKEATARLFLTSHFALRFVDRRNHIPREDLFQQPAETDFSSLPKPIFPHGVKVGGIIAAINSICQGRPPLAKGRTEDLTG
jgi:hypothetical protein